MRFNHERKNKSVDRTINSATDKIETITSASLNGRQSSSIMTQIN